MAPLPIQTLDDVRRLAETVLDPDRLDPVICVSIRHRESSPLIDVAALAAACDPLPVHVLPTGELSWELTALLPELFGVYGGAARIWWPGLRDTDDPRRHPLVFCLSAEEADAAQARLLRELRWHGYAQGTASAALPPPLHPASSAVEGGPAPVPAWDRPPWVRGSAMDDLAVGDVVDGRVVEAQPGGAEVEVAPGVRAWVVLRRRMGTVTVGDVLPVQIVQVDKQGQRVEVDPLPGRTRPAAGTASDTPPFAASETPEASPDAFDSAMAEAKAVLAEMREEAEDVRRELAGELAAARARVLAFAQTELRHIVETLERDLAEAQSEAASLRHRLREAERQHRGAVEEMRKHRDRANEATKTLRSEKDKLAALEQRLVVSGDPHEQFHHEVSQAVQQMGNLADANPVDYVLGQEFLASLDSLEGVERPRVVAVVARLVQNSSSLLASADNHVLRQSAAGGSPPVVRADGATAFRLSVQQGTPGARRLHYWRLPDGRVELANVAHHDDMRIT